MHAVGGVRGVAAVAAAGGDDAHGRLGAEHGADLDRGGLRAEKASVGEVEGVLRVAGRMVRGGVQGVEVVPDGLEFGSGDGDEAHAAEDGAAGVDGLADRVLAPEGPHAAGKRDVDRGRVLGFLLVDAGVCLVERGLDALFCLVERHARGALVFGGQFAHHRAEGGNGAVAAQRAVLDGLDVGRSRGCGQSRFRIGSDCLKLLQQFFQHVENSLKDTWKKEKRGPAGRRQPANHR